MISAVDEANQNLYCLSLRSLFMLSWSTTFLLIIALKSLLVTLRSLRSWYCNVYECSPAFLKRVQVSTQTKKKSLAFLHYVRLYYSSEYFHKTNIKKLNLLKFSGYIYKSNISFELKCLFLLKKNITFWGYQVLLYKQKPTNFTFK